MTSTLSEWTTFKAVLPSYKEMSLQQVMKMVAKEGGLRDAFPQLSQLASIALILPMTTAEGERCFSTMKRVKTDLRNRMGEELLEHLMRISIEGPPLTQMNFESAVDVFAAMRARRLNFVKL